MFDLYFFFKLTLKFYLVRTSLYWLLGWLKGGGGVVVVPGGLVGMRVNLFDECYTNVGRGGGVAFAQ